LREKIDCIKDRVFSADYHGAGKRSIANALALELKDTKFEEVVAEYPLGHARRGAPFFAARQAEILTVSLDQAGLEAMPGHQFLDLYVIQSFLSDFNAAIGSAATDTEICRRVFFMFDNWRGHEFFGIL
jgi:hypothetical protein